MTIREFYCDAPKLTLFYSNVLREFYWLVWILMKKGEAFSLCSEEAYGGFTKVYPLT